MRALVIACALLAALAAARLSAPGALAQHYRHMPVGRRHYDDESVRLFEKFIDHIEHKNLTAAQDLFDPNAFIYVTPYGCANAMNVTTFFDALEHSMSFIDQIKIDINRKPIVPSNGAYFVGSIEIAFKPGAEGMASEMQSLFPMKTTPKGFGLAWNVAFSSFARDGKIEIFEEFFPDETAAGRKAAAVVDTLTEAYNTQNISTFERLFANESTFEFWYITDGRTPMNGTRTDVLNTINATFAAGKTFAASEWSYGTCGVAIAHMASFKHIPNQMVNSGVLALTLSPDMSQIVQYTFLQH